MTDLGSLKLLLEGVHNETTLLQLLGRLESVLNETALLRLLGSLNESTRQRVVDLVNKMHVKPYEEPLMKYREYHLHKVLLLYVPPILIILGTFGNILSFIVLCTKSMRKYSTYFYLAILSFADILVLYIGLLRLWVGELTGYDLRDQADWLCKVINIVGYTVSDYSVWLIIAVTTERYLVVRYPLKASRLCNVRRALKVVLGLGSIMFLINVHFFWTLQIVYVHDKGRYIPTCESGLEYTKLVDEIWPWVDACLYAFAPFTVITVLNILIIRQVVKSRQDRRALQSLNCTNQDNRRSSHENSAKMTVMLLAISFAFLVTTFPMIAYLIATKFFNAQDSTRSERELSKFKLVRTVTELLMYCNHSLNFYLYCATGKKFRQKLLHVLCFRARSRPYWASEAALVTRNGVQPNLTPMTETTIAETPLTQGDVDINC